MIGLSGNTWPEITLSKAEGRRLFRRLQYCHFDVGRGHVETVSAHVRGLENGTRG